MSRKPKTEAPVHILESGPVTVWTARDAAILHWTEMEARARIWLEAVPDSQAWLGTLERAKIKLAEAHAMPVSPQADSLEENVDAP